MNTRKFLVTSLLILILLSTLAVSSASADPGHHEEEQSGYLTGDELLFGADGPGFSYVEPYIASPAQTNRTNRQARNISLVGALQLDPFNHGDHADVAAYKNLAFVGKWRESCPGTGVDIIDISNPSKPVKIADTLDHPDTSMEDMQAMRIGERDVLAIGLQDCGNTLGVGKVGLELYDITNPATPQLLSFFNTFVPCGCPVGHGAHELDLAKTPDGRALALLAVPNVEVATANPATGLLGGTGDLLILDISNPATPTLIGEWGVLDEPSLGFAQSFTLRQGGDPRVLGHSVRASADGTRAYLSYWDAGFITLDISDPANPIMLGRTTYLPGEEGNAHSADEARGGNLLVAADEDFTPYGLVFTSSAFAGNLPAVEAIFISPTIADLPGREMVGEVAHVGPGCPAGAIASGSPEDPYLADPNGKIALIEAGRCRFDHKIARAQLAGATGVIVYAIPGIVGERLLDMSGNDPTTLPSGETVDITIPAIFVRRSTAFLLINGAAPVTARAVSEFNGWGYLRVFDISDPAQPIQVGSYATVNVSNENVASEGWWTVHNPEVRGNTVYASWYSDGVRVIDISQPSAPREIGFWTGLGAPSNAPPVNIWSVIPHGNLLLASDMNFGLYILKLTP